MERHPDRRYGATMQISLRRLPLLDHGLYLVVQPSADRLKGGEIAHVSFNPVRETLQVGVRNAGFELADSQEPPEVEAPQYLHLSDLAENDLFRLLHKSEHRSELRYAARTILRLLDQMDAEDRRR